MAWRQHIPTLTRTAVDDELRLARLVTSFPIESAKRESERRSFGRPAEPPSDSFEDTDKELTPDRGLTGWRVPRPCSLRAPMAAMWARSRLTVTPPFRPASRASSEDHSWAVPFS